MGFRRSLVLALAIGAALGACSGGGGFTEEDLPRIVLQADEAPEATARAAQVSGAQPLEDFARDAAELEALRADGFRAAYVAYFPPTSFFEQEEAPDDPIALQAIAVLFEGPDGASSTMNRFAGDVRDRQLRDATDLPAEGLGEESFGLQGRAASDGSPLVAYIWRVRNLVLVLSGSGPLQPDEVAALAEKMDARAA